jgi:hypothetical protein
MADELRLPAPASSTIAITEYFLGDICWVAIRARGAEWSWLTPYEAAEIGRQWLNDYGNVSAETRSTPATTKKRVT